MCTKLQVVLLVLGIGLITSSLSQTPPAASNQVLRHSESSHSLPLSNNSQNTPTVTSNDSLPEVPQVRTVREARATEPRSARDVTMATQLVTYAAICVDILDDFKDDFMSTTHLKTWSAGEEREAPKTCEEAGCLSAASEVYSWETYLPVMAGQDPHFTPGVFKYELVRLYSLMQHYLVALHHLSLDQVFYAGSFMQQIDQLLENVERLMNSFRSSMEEVMTIPDNSVTHNLQVIYRREQSRKLREKRGFVFLRDTRAALQHTKDTLQIFT